MIAARGWSRPPPVAEEGRRKPSEAQSDGTRQRGIATMSNCSRKGSVAAGGRPSTYADRTSDNAAGIKIRRSLAFFLELL